MIRCYLMLLLAGCLCAPAMAQTTIATRIVKEGLFIPWELIYGPDDHIWFTQKNGYICRMDPASGATDTLLHETATVIRGEGGMTGLALHPDFPAQPYVFAVHNYLNGTNYRIRVMRYTYNGTNALTGGTVLLDGIVGSQNHNGSRLLIIGDKLYISTGDAENLSNPQNVASINGKILRINLDGTVPADNPMPGNPVWSWGHRNPQGMVYANNMLYSSEHGPNNDDEVNIIRKGRNYGWPTVAGFCDQGAEQAFCNDSNVVEPLRAWTPTLAVCGLDYYASNYFPQLTGSLLMATLKDQHLYQLPLNAAKDAITGAMVISGVSFGRLRDICVAPSGKIYISTSNSVAAGTGAFTDKIIELYNPAPTGVATVQDAGLQIYPNPAQQYLEVHTDKALSGTYRVLDVMGREVLSGLVPGARFRLDLVGLATGVYQLKLEGAVPVMRRFIKTE